MSGESGTIPRFLPSEVFRRWRIAARIGGFVIPLLVLGWGGFVLYITPREYEARVRFEVADGDPETAAVVACSQKTLMRTVESLDLCDRLNADRQEVLELLGERVEAQVIGGDVIELSARSGNAEDARDIAMESVKSLRDRVAELMDVREQARLDKLNKVIREQEDRVLEKQKVWITIVETLGPDPEEPVAQRDLAEARRELDHAEDLLFEQMDRYQRRRMELELPRPPLTLHAEPVLPRQPVAPDMDRELPALGLRVLIVALLLGVGGPYLLEACIPPRGEGDAEANGSDCETNRAGEPEPGEASFE